MAGVTRTAAAIQQALEKTYLQPARKRFGLFEATIFRSVQTFSVVGCGMKFIGALNELDVICVLRGDDSLLSPEMLLVYGPGAEADFDRAFVWLVEQARKAFSG